MHSTESSRSLFNIPLIDSHCLVRFLCSTSASLPFDIVPILSRERRKAPSEQKRNAEKIRDDDWFGPLADYFIPSACELLRWTSMPPFLYHCKLQYYVQTVFHCFVRCLLFASISHPLTNTATPLERLSLFLLLLRIAAPMFIIRSLSAPLTVVFARIKQRNARMTAILYE